MCTMQRFPQRGHKVVDAVGLAQHLDCKLEQIQPLPRARQDVLFHRVPDSRAEAWLAIAFKRAHQDLTETHPTVSIADGKIVPCWKYR